MASSPQSFSDRQGNRAIFRDAGEYSKYFQQLRLSCDLLLSCYRKQTESAQDEIDTVAGLMERLLRTVETLMLKYSHIGASEIPLEVDVTESGFPNFLEISALATDLQMKDARLRELPPPAILKRNLVDHLIKYKQDPDDILCAIGERCYLESLDTDKLFLPFTNFNLTRRGEDREHRSFLYAWGCFDFESNRPYFHLMAFDQNKAEPPLEHGNADFISVIREEGSRAPDLGIMALAIDDALEPVHPKVLKRVCLGPLYSRVILDHSPENPEDARQEAVRSILTRYGRSPNDLIMFFKDEVVFSVDQRSVRSLLSPLGKIREIFYIPEADPECYESRVSVVHRHVMMPHYLLASMSDEDRAAIPKFDSTHLFTYDEKGKVYGV